MDVICDLLWGSCGKGKFAAELAEKNGYHSAVTINGPNAGHTWRDNENSVVFKLIPSAIMGGAKEIFIGPDASASPERFGSEMGIAMHRGCEVYIHDHFTFVYDSDAEAERGHAAMTSIASTAQGTGHARSQKIMRHKEIIRDLEEYKDMGPNIHVVKTDEWLERLWFKHETRLLEVPQGVLLSLDFGHEYPYCTSRNITPLAGLASIGFPRAADTVWGIVRPYPIRVGNADGYSGDMGQKEITWAEVLQRAGAPSHEIDVVMQAEKTTVTKRLRRVSEFDFELFARSCTLTGCDKLILNFAQYLDWSVLGATRWSELSDTILDFIAELEDRAIGAKVEAVGIGAEHGRTIWRE